MLEFIENKISILESIEENNSSITSKQNLDNNKNKNSNVSTNSAKVFATNLTQNKTNTSNQIAKNGNNECIICKANHIFLFCSDYKNKSPKQREEIVAKKHRCYNCLGAHFIADCKCSICKQKHHTSLHIKGYKNNNENSNKRNNTNNPSTSKEVTSTETVALATNS